MLTKIISRNRSWTNSVIKLQSTNKSLTRWKYHCCLIMHLLVLLHQFSISNCQETLPTTDEIIPDDYDPEIRPQYKSNRNGDIEPINISITLYVNNLISIDEVEASFTTDLTLIQNWYDTRLNLSQIHGKILISDISLIRKFWLPDLYLINGISVSVIDAFTSIRSLTIDSQGKMNYMMRLNAKLSCYMNLQNYPHDYQYCKIKMSPLTYNSSEVRFVWNKFITSEFQNMNSKYKIRSSYIADCELWEMTMPDNSCILGTMKLVRRLAYYIIRYYTWTFLCTVASFIGFWIPVNAWPARITVIVLPLLNLITLDISINNEVGVNYVVSIHWWMMWIHGFFYLELIEYAVAIQWAHFVADKKRFKKQKEQERNNESMGENNNPLPDKLPGYYFGNSGWYYKCGEFFDKFNYFFFGYVDMIKAPMTQNKIDYVCRVFFVVAWLLFCFIYAMCCFVHWSHNYYFETDDEYRSIPN